MIPEATLLGNIEDTKTTRRRRKNRNKPDQLSSDQDSDTNEELIEEEKEDIKQEEIQNIKYPVTGNESREFPLQKSSEDKSEKDPAAIPDNNMFPVAPVDSWVLKDKAAIVNYKKKNERIRLMVRSVKQREKMKGKNAATNL